jgi:hypothetical protein
MRIFIPLLVQLVGSSTPRDLSRDILVTFVSLECIDEPEPAEPRTSLPPIINRFTQKLLVKWFLLDEEAFVEYGKPIIKVVHDVVMSDPREGRYLENNIRPLRDQGLGEEEILDLLTRRYYRALQRMGELKKLAGRS